MTRLIVIGLAGLALAACGSAEQREAEDQARCVSTGTAIGSKAYTDCRAALASQREAQERAQIQANMNSNRRQVGR